eukprot:TRINITY_DN7437_c0_g1_i1.p1 TRINITY_DN7437_c0_g1~~TRINITY_DN7437_c0_g1_i1.p1  ORF type:complete len:334 (-),score=49.30 TRINITY_DN7437_c0_g1_i1:168-1169(-)
MEERLSLAYQGLRVLNGEFIQRYSSSVKFLDLTSNLLNDLRDLQSFSQLTVLILDDNQLSSETPWPLLSKLNTLWVNKNRIDKLEPFINILSNSTPNLKFLCMLNNKACPHFLSDQEYRQYRYYVICRLPKLQALDSTPISREEREAAKRWRCGFNGGESTSAWNEAVVAFSDLRKIIQTASEPEILPPRSYSSGVKALQKLRILSSSAPHFSHHWKSPPTHFSYDVSNLDTSVTSTGNFSPNLHPRTQKNNVSSVSGPTNAGGCSNSVKVSANRSPDTNQDCLETKPRSNSVNGPAGNCRVAQDVSQLSLQTSGNLVIFPKFTPADDESDSD